MTEPIHPTSLLSLDGLLAAPSVNPPGESPTSLLDRDLSAGTAQAVPTRGASGLPPHLRSVIPALIGLTGRILQELEMNLPRLLALNPSRREAVAQYLDCLAGLPPGPSLSTGSSDPAGGLRRWVEGPRSPAQDTALKIYFEELALVFLGQAVLLKSWSDRALRPWNEADLGRLNWALSTALRAHVPIDRDGWQITRQNIYSWYNPSPSIQHDTWLALESWRITNEGPDLITGLITSVRQSRRERPEYLAPQGYDVRFFDALWNFSPAFGYNPEPDTGPFKRDRMAYSPTLRDGAMARTGPRHLAWVGSEAAPFQLLMAELTQLWRGPGAPPLWAPGAGLETHTREQLPLGLGSPKPSLVTRIAEMEACDIAFVLEERTVRAQGRTPEAQRFREQVDALAYYRGLRAPGTSLGALQACLALSKLRPGGLLWWAREEALSPSDGGAMLGFLLERGQLVCEWDLADLSHALPASLPLFPKHVYLWRREPDVQARSAHRPMRITLQGQVRSHIEVPGVLEDALLAPVRAAQSRGPWEVRQHQSPTPQKDWAERWPDPASQATLQALERLRARSLALAQVLTVRPLLPGYTAFTGQVGFRIQSETDGRRLTAAPLPKSENAPRRGEESRGASFAVLVPDESWTAPLAAYLESEAVSRWLDHYAERRGGRWVLSEQVVKWIPVPKSLLQALGQPFEGESGPDLSREWAETVSDAAYHPERAREAIEKDGRSLAPDALSRVRAEAFVRAARAFDYFRSGQDRALALVRDDGQLKWRELLDLLPKGECIAVTVHPRVHLTGTLPPHIAIDRIERVRMPLPGLAFTTESGFRLHLGADSGLILDLVESQLEGLTHPTWSELTRYLRLPRRLELAEATASDVLRSHGEATRKQRALGELLATCLPL